MLVTEEEKSIDFAENLTNILKLRTIFSLITNLTSRQRLYHNYPSTMSLPINPISPGEITFRLNSWYTDRHFTGDTIIIFTDTVFIKTAYHFQHHANSV